MSEIKQRNLNQQQLNTLELLYTFRFITAQLLREYKQLKSIRSVNRHLATLLELGLIDQRYDKSYKLRGKGASYCLTAKGAKLLWDNNLIHLKARNNMYKNQKVKQPFVEHCLSIVRVFLKLRDIYDDEFHIYTRHELGQFDYFPANPPDLYLNRDTHYDDTVNEYFIDICTYMPIYKIKQKLVAYRNHQNEDDWDDKAETEYPDIGLICREPRVEMSVQRFVEDKLSLDNSVSTTNIRAFMSGEMEVWRECEEPEEQVGL